jgi:glutathione S-transferase
MSEDVVIHGVPGSPYVRSALLGCEEKGIPYRLEPLQVALHGPEHLKLHPFGRVPILEHGGFRLYETQAMLRYIDSLDGAAGAPALQPRDPRAAARMNQIVGIVDWYVFPTISVGITAERLMSQRFWNRPPDEANIAKALPAARVCLGELERLQGDSPFMVGDRVSLADLMLAPQLDFFRAAPEGTELLKGTSLDGWLTRMGMRASMQATQAERLRKSA